MGGKDTTIEAGERGGGGGMLCNDPSDRIGGKVGNFAAAFSLPN
jgi:hypothetical protein